MIWLILALAFFVAGTAIDVNFNMPMTVPMKLSQLCFVATIALIALHNDQLQRRIKFLKEYEKEFRVQDALLSLSVKPEFARTWWDTPNEALEGWTPRDKLKAGDFATVRQVIFYLGTGVPS